MVHKVEKIYCINSISDKWVSSFFISLILSLSFYSFLFFFPFYLFRFNFVVSQRNMTFLFAVISGRNFLFSFGPFWAELFSKVGGGGVHVHPVHPPCVRAWTLLAQFKIVISSWISRGVCTTETEAVNLRLKNQYIYIWFAHMRCRACYIYFSKHKDVNGFWSLSTEAWLWSAILDPPTHKYSALRAYHTRVQTPEVNTLQSQQS